MVTYASFMVECAICGAASEQRQLNSYSVFGPPDLDLRPAPMARNLFAESLQECSSCGFVSADITEATEAERAAVRSPDYGRSWDTGFPASRVAQTMCRAAEIARSSGDWAAAGLRLLMAAWDCDDREAQEESRRFRSLSADFWMRAIEVNDINPATLALATRTIDVLRRAGRFEEATAVADRVLEHVAPSDDMIRKVAEHGRRAAMARDEAAYTAGDLN